MGEKQTALAEKKDAPKLELAKPVGDWGTLDRVLRSQLPAIQKVISKALTPEKLARMVLTACRSSKSAEKVLKCSGASVAKAFMDCAEVGLSPTPSLGQCCFVPYGNELVYQVEYRGFIALAKRSGQVSYITADVVRDKEFFECMRGTGQYLHHSPTGEGDPVKYYAIVRLKDGAEDFRVMTKERIEAHRDRYSKAKDSSDSAWKTAFDAMAMKTVIRQLCKLLELSPELTKAALIDEYNEAGIRTVEVEDITKPGRHKISFHHPEALPEPEETPQETEVPKPATTPQAPLSASAPAGPSDRDKAVAALEDVCQEVGVSIDGPLVKKLLAGRKREALSADEIKALAVMIPEAAQK